MGKRAACLLLDKIGHPERIESSRIVLPEKLAIRKTTACPFVAAEN
jgi:DNA-binding LacI/PurR family transcriptional regulator